MGGAEAGGLGQGVTWLCCAQDRACTWCGKAHTRSTALL